MPFNSGCAVLSEAASGFGSPRCVALTHGPACPPTCHPPPYLKLLIYTPGAIGRDGDGNAQVALVAPVLNRFAAQWRVNGGSGVTVE